MTASQKPPPPSTTIRLVHGALLTGLLLFAIVSHFVLKPTTENSGVLPAPWVLALSVGVCVLSLFLRRRIRPRSPDESSDAFWMTASPLALQMWTPLEAVGLLAVVL